MSTVHVHVYVPGREDPIPGQLTTESSSSSYGHPVLILRGSDAGQSFPADELIAHDQMDLTRWGPACTLPIQPVDAAHEAHPLVRRWKLAAGAWRGAYGLTMGGHEVAT